MALTDEFEAFTSRREDEWKRVVTAAVAMVAIHNPKPLTPEQYANGKRVILLRVNDGYIAESRHIDTRVVGSTQTGVATKDMARIVIDIMRIP